MKSQIPNSKIMAEEETANTKQYDLAERTYLFVKELISLTKPLPQTIANIEMVKQLIRSAGSVGANYIEADEAL